MQHRRDLSETGGLLSSAAEHDTPGNALFIMPTSFGHTGISVICAFNFSPLFEQIAAET